MKAVISPGKLNGRIPAPPSKSYAHRMLIGAALAGGQSTLTGISSSEDMLATMDCISALHAETEYEPLTETVRIKGIGTQKGRSSEEACEAQTNAVCGKGNGTKNEDSTDVSGLPVFPCRESGSTLRFFIPIALALFGGGCFTGTERLIERGIGVYEELFRERGIAVEKTEKTVTVKGTLPAGTYQLKGDISSQFVTGLLFALSLLEEESCIQVLPPVESRPYIDITLDVMRTFGAEVSEPEENRFVIKGGQTYAPGEFRVEGDWSNAAFLYGFRAIGNDLSVTGLKEESIQGDKACVRFFEQLKEKETLPCIDLSETPDLGPVLFAAAAALGGARFTGTRRLRIKESDRAQAMAEELLKFGVQVHVEDNEVTVLPSVPEKPAVPLFGHNDHRIVMALSMLCSLTGGTIEGCEAVKKSWPDYFTVLKENGLCVEIIE